eukprot:5606962-Prymnesium_polylepis.1
MSAALAWILHAGPRDAPTARWPTAVSAAVLFEPTTCGVHESADLAFLRTGYGIYRDNCTLHAEGNAWHCTAPMSDASQPRAGGVVPMRMIVESMDADHTSRSLTPVALASGGFVDLMNAGWDHQRAKDCGGYGCLTRLMTFHTTVGNGRAYDLTFTATNPQKLRLMLPHGAGDDSSKEAARVVLSIFYSNPQKLEVYLRRRLVQPLEAHMRAYNSYNYSMRKPTVTDPCGSNAYAAWEHKIYVVVCGGIEGVEIRTVDKIVLSLGIETTTS